MLTKNFSQTTFSWLATDHFRSIKDLHNNCALILQFLLRVILPHHVDFAIVSNTWCLSSVINLQLYHQSTQIQDRQMVITNIHIKHTSNVT